MLIETYAAMLNRKIFIPSQKSNYIAVEKGYWIEFFGLRVANVRVDEHWYLSRYADVSRAIENGVVETASQHYNESGYFEHRMPYQIEVDSSWYCDQYLDVKGAIDTKVFSSAQEHFETIGFKEGRYPFANFTLHTRSEVVDSSGNN